MKTQKCTHVACQPAYREKEHAYTFLLITKSCQPGYCGHIYVVVSPDSPFKSHAKGLPGDFLLKSMEFNFTELLLSI